MTKVFLGVGHGGNDSGAIANGQREKDMTLKIANACREYLEDNGISVRMSRYQDENDSVTEEVKECNAYGPALAVDIHINAGGGDGFEIYHTVNGGTGKTLAQNIEAQVKALGQNSRGVKIRKNSNGKDYYAFIRTTKCPAVIAELGFIDNLTDLQAFDEDRELKAFGGAYARGILKTLGWTTGTEPAPSEGAKPNSGYNGNSIVDYLKSIGKDSSFNARKQYAQQYGIANYSGTAEQNTALLNAMRGSVTPAPAPANNYYPAFNSGSIVDGLKFIGVDSSYTHRKQIANANGITNYSGTASQNEQLCALARQGKLIKA